MRKSTLLLLIGLSAISLLAQDSMEQIMEMRAKEFHRILSLSDRDSYKKFMKENYTKEYLEKPIKLNRVINDDAGGSSKEDNKPLDNLDAKAGIFEQLHRDFGGAAVSSLTRRENKIELTIKSPGLKGKFTLMFSKENPYLIEGMGIEADMEN